MKTYYNGFIKKLICLLLTITLILTSFTGCKNTSAETNKNKNFKNFCDQLFVDIVSADGITLNYTLKKPSKYNISTYPTSFGYVPLSPEDNYYKKADKILDDLDKYEYKTLSLDEQYAYDTISWHYNNIVNESEYIYHEEYLSPSSGIQIQLPILLSEYHFYTKKDIENYLNLLPDIERYFTDICEFEKLKQQHGLFMSRTSANKVLSQCKTLLKTLDTSIFVTEFNNRVEAIKDISQNEIYEFEKKNLDIVNNQVKNAYTTLYKTINTLNKTNSNTGCMMDYADGRDYYAHSLNKTTGSNRSVKNMISILENTITLNSSQLLNLISKNRDVKLLDLTTDYGINDTEKIITSIKGKMNDYFPDIVDVKHTIKNVPEEIASHLNPAFYVVSPIDDHKNNTIYINSSAEYSGNPLFTNIAHEAFPGHLYQNAYFCQNNDIPIRNVIKNTGYVEGWASYITNLSYGYTEMDAAQVSISKYNDAIVLCLSARADIGVHYEGWTARDISNYFTQNNCTLDNAAIKTLYNIIIDDPGDYLSYAIGYIEITRLLEDAKENMQDDFSLKKFHTFLLDAGPTPFSSIKSHIQEELYH